MAETPWTKGPWAVSDLPGGSLCVDATVDLPDGGKIGRVICQWVYRDTHIDDARLIAAAPMLYEALEGEMSRLDAEYSDLLADTQEGGGPHDLRLKQIDAARAALARARGDE